MAGVRHPRCVLAMGYSLFRRRLRSLDFEQAMTRVRVAQQTILLNVKDRLVSLDVNNATCAGVLEDDVVSANL